MQFFIDKTGTGIVDGTRGSESEYLRHRSTRSLGTHRRMSLLVRAGLAVSASASASLPMWKLSSTTGSGGR